VEVWQTSNLQRLRIGDGKKKKTEEDRRNHRTKIEWPAVLGGHKEETTGVK